MRCKSTISRTTHFMQNEHHGLYNFVDTVCNPKDIGIIIKNLIVVYMGHDVGNWLDKNIIFAERDRVWLSIIIEHLKLHKKPSKKF